MRLRFLVEPTMAIFLAVRARRADARLGKPPYFWALLTDASHREETCLVVRGVVSKFGRTPTPRP